MDIENIECKLVDVKQLDMGSHITLQRKDNNEIITIAVDENVSRIIKRLKEQYEGDDSREGIYLSRMMTNIDISTDDDVWYINQEDKKYYTFDKNDVVDIIERYERQ